MAIDTETRASRRNILAAALGAVGGVLAGRLGSPYRAAATQGDPVTVGGTFQGTSPTSFEDTTAGLAEYSLRGHHASDGSGVFASANGVGSGLHAIAFDTGGHAVLAQSLDAAGVFAISTTTTPPHPGVENAGVIGIAGDASGFVNTDVSETGVYGFCDTSASYASGVWGDSIQGAGVVGTGAWGVYAIGYVGVRAIGAIALQTTGRLVFAGRSGHGYVASGHYYRDIAISGMSSGADVIATLRTRKSGYYIAAVASYSGKFRVYLNKTATSTIYFNFLVLN